MIRKVKRDSYFKMGLKISIKKDRFINLSFLYIVYFLFNFIKILSNLIFMGIKEGCCI